MRGEGKAVVGIGVGSAVIASAGINHAVTGLSEATGATSKALGNAVAAGDYAWDDDGNFVCSRFIFNFRTGEIFDSLQTYKASAIDRFEAHGNIIKIYRGVTINTIPVGSLQRADAIIHLIDLMQKGTVLQPEGGRLKSFDKRAGKLGFARIFAFAWLSLFLGLALMVLNHFSQAGLGGTVDWSTYKYCYLVAFAGLVGLQKLKPVRRPNWSMAAATSGQ